MIQEMNRGIENRAFELADLIQKRLLMVGPRSLAVCLSVKEAEEVCGLLEKIGSTGGIAKNQYGPSS